MTPTEITTLAELCAAAEADYADDWNAAIEADERPDLWEPPVVEVQVRALRALLAEREGMRGAWDWLSSRKTLSLEHYSPVYCDDDDQAEEWRVHQVSGGINDREWEVVGAGPTPLAAVSAARAALSPAPKEPEHD